MNLDALRKHCATLPGVTRDIKWGADEAYSVGEKMFAVFWIDKGKARTVSFKCDPERFLELTDQSALFRRPTSLARTGCKSRIPRRSVMQRRASSSRARTRWFSPS